MIEIGRTIISIDLFTEHFACDLTRCKGACCIEGDSGAPVTEEEAGQLEAGYPAYAAYLPPEHISEIQNQGFSIIDRDGDLVTPLVRNRQCAYSFYDENGILKCAVEKAFFEKGSELRKPVSCHLFPVRINEYRHFDAVNYQKIEICQPGRECGGQNKIPLYRFLRDPLIRRYGEQWYSELVKLAEDKNFIRKIRSL